MTRIEGIYGSDAVVVEKSVAGGETPAYVGVVAVGYGGGRTGVHLTGSQVRDVIEALKPYAAKGPLAEWERELLSMKEEPIQEVDGFRLGDEVEGYIDGRGVIVGFEDEAMKRGASGDVVVDWSEGSGLAGKTLGATLSLLTKVEPKPVQEIPTGTTVKVLDDGTGPGQVVHFGPVGGFAKVIGWSDTSAEPWDYDETYEIEIECGTSEPLLQSVAPSTIRPITLAEALDRAEEAVAAITPPARYVTGLDSTDPAVKMWSEAISDRPFVSFGDDEDDEPKSRFSVGDRVRVIDAGGDSRAEVGMVGTVRSVGGYFSTLIYVDVEGLDSQIAMHEERFESAPEPEHGFSVGDRVKIVGGPYLGGASSPGGTGTVVVVREGSRPLWVQTDDAGSARGQRLHYATDEVEKVEEHKVAIRLGDKVRIVKSPFFANGLQPGDTGRIIEVDPAGVRGDFALKMDGGSEFVRSARHGWGFQEDEIEHVSGTYSPVSCDLCGGPCVVPNDYR